MLTGILCLTVFLIMALAMYGRKISALLALPLMAFAIALIGGVEPQAIVKEVFANGAVKLHNAYTATMFGAMLAELINKHGMAKSLVRFVAEFAGDSPYILGVMLTLVTALLFSTLGGLGAVIMVGTIILPVMLSIGIPALAAAGLFLFGISIGGIFNLTNWQLYTDVLKIDQATIFGFVAPFSLVLAFVVLLFLLIELKDRRNWLYFGAGLLGLGALYFPLQALSPAQAPGAVKAIAAGDVSALTQTISGLSYQTAAVMLVLLALYATYRHYNKQDNLPAVSLLTPIVPLIFVLLFRWDIIPAFILGLVYGTLTTWRRDSINILTRSIIDGVSNVIPAVLLMMGIGMLINAVMDKGVSSAIAPIIQAVIPSHSLWYVITFTLIAPLALYRGPLSLWGMGSGLVSLVLKVTSLSAQAVMGMLLSVGQIQGICDPTNTQNIWVATYLSVDTQTILRKTIPYAWLAVLMGLCLAVYKGFVQ
ncbi:MAG: citrate transporter [Candidatus Obscuribacter sp.]|jgi:H+/gluconate symporter-like permease|nr:citrate transporter [Candidatus Obscuribacter sp.]